MLAERAAAAGYGTQFVLFERLPAQGTPVACGLKFAEFVPIKDGNDDAALSVLGSVMVQVMGGVAAAHLKLGIDLMRVEKGKVKTSPLRPLVARLRSPTGKEPRILTSTRDEDPNALFVVLYADEAFHTAIREAVSAARLSVLYSVQKGDDPWQLDVELDVATVENASGKRTRSREHLAAFTQCLNALPLPVNPR
jgi:hypothetical protein